MAPNFTECSTKFHDNETLFKRYEYSGRIHGAYGFLNDSTLPKLISVEGCRNVCGLGAELYSWADASGTISTWVLPMVGLMLQAPYESNELISTAFFMARIIGSPIATMAYILWNIKISGQCALMIDMSSNYNEYPEVDSQFEQMRDSFYLLSIMNQYSIKKRMPRKEAEKLIRVALWSDCLQLEVVEDESRSLVKRRRKLARSIREARKRGVVPVFISMMWFLFSLIISIQAAFGQMGENMTAHNLALGLLLAWLPSLILFSVVDRNPIAADTIRIKLNRLLNATRRALLDPQLRETYIKDIEGSERDFRWTDKLIDEDYFQDGFFQRFAGQGRARWHYGVGPPILAGIERTPITSWSRGWLSHGDKARTILVKGPEKLYELHWFDWKCLWQVAASFAIVAASCGGAFIISYFTPTAGLGCRSGGYVVYFLLAFLNLILEAMCWAFVTERSTADQDPLTRLSSNIGRRLPRWRSNNWGSLGRDITETIQYWWTHLTAREKIEALLLRPLDVINSLWLSYIVLSQVFGFYQTCDCQSSIWTSVGGYMDFESYDFYRGVGVKLYWGNGTALSIFALSIAFTYAITEWGQQSHMSTLDYEAAHKGLKMTRRFRRFTEDFHAYRHHFIEAIKRSVANIIRRSQPTHGDDPALSARKRNTMMWTSRTGPSNNIQNTPRFSRTATVEMENGSGRREASESSQNYEMERLPSTNSMQGIGISFAKDETTTRYGHSKTSSIVEPVEAHLSVSMSRDASRSSQGIERKPLLSASSPSLYASPRISFGEQSWSTQRPQLDTSLGRGSEEAVGDADSPLTLFQQLHTRTPRSSYGEQDLIPPAIPRSEPVRRSSEEVLELPDSVPRSRAY